MIRLLTERNEALGLQEAFVGDRRIVAMKEAVQQAPTPERKLEVLFALSFELLNRGHPDEALAAVTAFRRLASRAGISVGPETRAAISYHEGLASLRLAEAENCIKRHNLDSCIFPIQSGGIHGEPLGAEKAAGIFTQLATANPNDYASRWLLNLSLMTLGKYPDRVPPNLLIPESSYLSTYPMPRFPEVATRIGLAGNDIAGGTIIEDFDGDGLLDVMFSSWSAAGQLRLFRNNGAGRFTDVTGTAGLLGLTGGLNLMQTDYNNDGKPDVYIVRGAWFAEAGRVPDSLLRNNGDGTFEDVTEASGLLAFHPALSAVWFDANNDGWLDLFVGNETTGDPLHPCQLFLNRRDGTFFESATNSAAAVIGNVKGVTAGDYDNDGWTDLYVSRLGQPNVLLRNDGRKAADDSIGARFTDVTARAGVANPQFSFPTWFWDYDNDGWLDLFVSGYTTDFGQTAVSEVTKDRLGLPSKIDKARLYRNRGNGTFQDVTQEAGLNRVIYAMGANFGELDNDGFLDFYAGTGDPGFGSLLPNEMFRNDRGRAFQNVTAAGGFGHLQKGHGVAFGDLNNDGFQDVVVNVGGAYPGDNYFDAVFANPGGTNRWISLRLLGTKGNRAAIGARIKVVVQDATGPREIHRTVNSGGSFGANPLRQHIGLGPAGTIARVEVWWPTTGITNRIRAFEPGRHYEIEEGKDTALPVSLKSFPLPLTPGS